MSTLTTINATDKITDSREVINNNFTALNNEKIETSYLDTDTSLTANSDTKIPTQKAVKAYVDSGGNQNASETAKGIVEEATDAEVTAGTATGATGAKLFVTPAKLATRLSAINAAQLSSTRSTGQFAIDAKKAVYIGNGSTTYIDGQQTTSNTNITFGGNLGSEDYAAQTFKTSAYTEKITSVELSKYDSATATFQVSICATSGGTPVLPLLVTKSVTVNSPQTGWFTATFDTPLSVTANTTYAIVVWEDTNDNWLSAHSAGSYGDGEMFKGNLAGSFSVQSGYDLLFKVNALHSVSGKIYQAIDGSDIKANNFIGFTNENISASSSGSVIIDGIVSGLTGLTTGATYYLSATPGAIATSGTKKVGLAISDTELLIKHDNS